MSHYKKLYQKIKNNPKDVRFKELEKLMTKVGGFDSRPGNGDHVVFKHPDIYDQITVDTRGNREPLKRYIVIKCLRMFDELNPGFGRED